MFNVNDLIVHKKYGVCRITDIDCLSDSIKDRDKQYYILEPIYVSGSKVFIPVGNTKMIRNIISEEYAYQLINDISSIEAMWIDNDKSRELYYKESLNEFMPIGLIKILKTIYQRKIERLSDGKALTSVDHKYMKIAEDFLFGELSMVIGKEKDDIETFILENFEKSVS